MPRLHLETPPPMSSLWSPIQTSDEWIEEPVLTQAMLDELIEEPVLTAQSPPSSPSLHTSITSQITTPRTTPSSKKEKELANRHPRGPHEMHHGMKTLMTETYRALMKYQWEFHLLLQSRRALELQVPRDYEQEQQLNSQAMEKLNRYQLYRELHLRQYQLVDRFPAPWEELPLRSTISAGNPGMRIATYLDNWLVPVSRSEDSPSKQTLTQPLGTNITTDDHELSSSIPMNSPSMSTESSFQLSSSPENWAPSNQVEPTLSTLSFGMYHVPENHIAIPRRPPLTGYEIFPYPMGVPTRRNHPSIEETREEGVEEPRQPSAAEQLLAGVFDTGLERLLIVLDFVQTRDRITEVAAELAALIWRLEEITLGLDPSSMHGTL
ncbi:hypothetical protein HETIRDRAFT_447255 [Heterobasidion irregulare TC 32-1]|uniref:Uncharacterized protein n=1 Tax=Heterobasidion irregulare (strain TC 32-1) TaxID=747525 RepID=W4KNA3_HETIT|nr:uncharacterized protein HETIRDRAFT_447255 [Heterobasidion irregulare TC 32-1]ETW86536.1 hypothetical protein HETIRDRAFT_447255 [Heterobasidion irregulare TC 32-1]